MADLGIPDEGSRATPPAGDWVPSGTPGYLVRPLIETPGFSTQLMRVEPGAYAPPHAHDTVEQVYVIEGDLYDDGGGEHTAGTFIVRAAGAIHSGGSRGGATILVVYGDVR